MNQFDLLVEKLLKEIPYIDYINQFDLEIETRNNVKDFLRFLDGIFNGKTETDKYGNSITLSKPEDRGHFLANLKNDPMLKKWADRQNENDKRVINDFFKIVNAKLAIKKPRSAYY